MRITKEQLKQIIKEELEDMMSKPTMMRLPKYNMPEVAEDLENAYNSEFTSVMAPNYQRLAADFKSDKTFVKMEDYANMLQFREDEWQKLNPSKDSKDFMRLINWIDGFSKTIR